MLPFRHFARFCRDQTMLAIVRLLVDFTEVPWLVSPHSMR